MDSDAKEFGHDVRPDEKTFGPTWLSSVVIRSCVGNILAGLRRARLHTHVFDVGILRATAALLLFLRGCATRSRRRKWLAGRSSRPSARLRWKLRRAALHFGVSPSSLSL